MSHHELVDPEVLATVAPVVAETPGAIDERLLRESREAPRVQEFGSLDAGEGAEGPARPAHGLILYRSDSTVEAPVEGIRRAGDIGRRILEGLSAVVARGVP